MLTVVAPGDSFQFLHESRRNQHQFTLKLHVIWAKGEKRKREEEKGGYVCMDTSCTPGEGGGVNVHNAYCGEGENVNYYCVT